MIKNIILIMIALFATVAFVGAEWSPRPNTVHTQSIIEIRDAGEAATWTEINTSNFNGGAIYQWEIICTDDDAVDFSLATQAPDGTNYTPIASVTTTAADDADGLADVGLFDDYYVVGDTSYYKLENISSGTCSCRITKWDK
jgi:hypothetical protein